MNGSYESVLQEAGGQTGFQVGRLVATNLQGQPFVDFEGNEHGPLLARLALPPSEMAVLLSDQPPELLLAFQQGDLQRPLIAGIVRDRLPTPAEPLTGRAVTVDGEIIRIEGHQQIELQCGKASITLRKDGQIIVKGSKLLSRASESNKIKGGSVLIN